MKNTVLLSLAVVLAMAMSSCSKNSSSTTSSTPMSQKSQLSYQLKTTNNTSALARTTGAGSITWTSGFAYPRMVKFEAVKDNVKVELESTDTGRVDLMASLDSSFGGFTLPSGTYREIEIKIDLDRNASYPALQLDGTFTDSTVTLPIELQINEPLELQTEQNNVTITDTTSLVAITTLDLSALTSGVTPAMLLSAATSGGVVIISPTYNRDIYMVILHNFMSEHHHCDFEHRHGHH